MTLPTPLFESGLLTQDLADVSGEKTHSINSEQSRLESLNICSKQDSKSSVDETRPGEKSNAHNYIECATTRKPQQSMRYIFFSSSMPELTRFRHEVVACKMLENNLENAGIVCDQTETETESLNTADQTDIFIEVKNVME